MSNDSNLRYQLFSQGIFIDPMAETVRLKNLAQRLRPLKTEHPLVRVGANGDGGYLLPDDFAGVRYCLSPGVDQIASFEEALLARGIQSHLADLSVDGPPAGVSVASFTKKFIGVKNDDRFITLQQWIHDIGIPDVDRDLILQMDIEGAEYAALLNASENLLSRFRIIAVEFHDVETWSQKHFLNIVEALFDKLLGLFYVVHNHPNNAMGIVNMNNFFAPRLLEITLHRKDRVQSVDGFAQLPHAQDFPNVPQLPDLLFPKDWA